jgi:hypothetical protein
LNFHAVGYEWLVVTDDGPLAQYKGVGTIDGMGEYEFMIWATDQPDQIRFRLWSEDEDGVVQTVLYDNVTMQELGGGSIVIHR